MCFKIIFFCKVAGALDRVNLTDNSAMFVVASVAKALGHPIGGLALSRSTIRRSRMETRKEVTEADKCSFSSQLQSPLLLHWDGKLLPDIAGSKETVDRIAIIVTGGGVEKLLAVPKIGKGTGYEQASACLKVLDDWKINTGIHKGACTLIEEASGQKLIYFI